VSARGGRSHDDGVVRRHPSRGTRQPGRPDRRDELPRLDRAVEAITPRALGDPDLANLPRKFKTAVTGHRARTSSTRSTTSPRRALDHPRGSSVSGTTWGRWRTEHSAHLAVRLGAFVAEDESRVWAGVIGSSATTVTAPAHKARLKYLVADWGAERFVMSCRRYLHAVPDGPRAPDRPAPATTSPVHAQKDGRSSSVHAGGRRVSGPVLAGLADLAEAAGSHPYPADADQKLRRARHPRGARRDGHPRPGAARHAVGTRRLSTQHDRLHRHRVLQAWIVETKATAASAIDELDRRLAGDRSRPGAHRS